MSNAIDPFHALTISALAHRLKAQGRSIIHMEFGQPSTGAPPAAIAAAHHVLDTDGMGYWESGPLCDRIARHYGEDYGVSVASSRVVLTAGASPALMLVLSSMFAPGDRVALARPSYVAYRNTLKTLHMVPIELPCGPAERFQITPAMIAQLDPVPKGLILASPGNPTGTIIPPEDFAEIAEICRRRGIKIISDEIYHGLSYGAPARSMLEFEPDAAIINSFSKYYSMAGWRLGWVVAPDGLVDDVRARSGNLFLTPPSLAQHAALAAFDCRDILDGHRATYARNRDLLLAALPRLGIDRVAPPDGAFYLYADVGRYTNDSLAFCLATLEATGVATSPGIDFDPIDGHRFMRFSFAASTDRVEDAIERLIPWFAGLPANS